MKHPRHALHIFQSQIALLFCVAFICSCSHSPSQENSPFAQRYRIIFENNVVGTITHERQLSSDMARSVDTLKMRTQFRGLEPILNRIVEIEEEDSQGNALGFSKTIDIPNARHVVTGEIHDSRLTLRDRHGDKEQISEFEVPDDFLMGENLRMKMRSRALEGQSLVYSEWDFNEHRFRRVHLDFVADKNTWHIFQRDENGSGKAAIERVADENFFPLRTSLAFLGKTFYVERCEAQCASEKMSAFRPFDYQMLPSPYLITDAALKGHIRYQLQASDSSAPAVTGEQTAARNASDWMVDVCANCEIAKSPPPEDIGNYLAANTWLEATDPRLVAIVERNTDKGDSPSRRMEKLTSFTRKWLEDNPQFAGYATALQAYQSRTGDCTEYALLLAALGRAAQVPTRVIFGMSYSRERFHGKANAFAPHAWVQAWIDGAWRSYDAALEGFDAGHIALKISDGNLRDLFGMFENFEKFKIVSMQQIVRPRSQATE